MLSSTLLPKIGALIGGQWKTPSSGKTIRVTNPATGELLAEMPGMGAAETTAAVEAGERALQSAVPAEERKKWLTGIVAKLEAHREELARIITQEQGKPLGESRAEVDYSAGFFKFYVAQLGKGVARTLPEKIRNMTWAVHLRPAGVAGLIVPWNFPMAMLAKKLAAALAAGAPSVIKPAELTPLSTIALAHVCEQAGVAAGYVNVVCGDAPAIGKVLCEHPAVRVISFTGSTHTGQILARQSADHVKRLSLELGGNAPFIVFEDANLELAADGLIMSKFRCAGQTCVCANRVYVHESVMEKFVPLVVERVNRLKMGNGLEEDTTLGPVINRSAFEKVDRHVKDALKRGAKKVAGAEAGNPSHDWGFFYPPTVLTGITPEMDVFREETFGPVVAIGTFREEKEVIASANSTPFGLAAYVFTQDAQKAQRCAEQLKFGYVAVNSGTGPIPEAPFGGMKMSGYGREGGEEGFHEFVEQQTVGSA